VASQDFLGPRVDFPQWPGGVDDRPSGDLALARQRDCQFQEEPKDGRDPVGEAKVDEQTDWAASGGGGRKWRDASGG
jgi:hypothetical protein